MNGEVKRLKWKEIAVLSIGKPLTSGKEAYLSLLI